MQGEAHLPLASEGARAASCPAQPHHHGHPVVFLRVG